MEIIHPVLVDVPVSRYATQEENGDPVNADASAQLSSPHYQESRLTSFLSAWEYRGYVLLKSDPPRNVVITSTTE